MSNQAPEAKRDVQARPLINRLVQVASTVIGGKFVLASFGEDPATDEKLTPEVVHVPNAGAPAERCDQLMAAIEHLARRRGANVYIAPALFRPELSEGRKGEKSDVLWSLAVVSDFDRKQDPTTRRDRLPLEPHAEVESSAGNFQTWLFFDQPYRPKDVAPVLLALSAKTGDDCKTTEHVFRIPGCLNWPAKQKREKLGRSPIPDRAKLVLMPEDWFAGYTLDEVKAAMMAKWPDVFDAKPASASTTDFDWDKAKKDVFDPFSFGEAHERLSNIKYLSDRSKGTFRFMKLCVRRGYTPEQVVTTMLEHDKAPLMDHYGSPVDEARVRADVIRAFTKKDRPQREKLAEDIFRVSENLETGAKPIRVIQIYGGDLPTVINEAEAALIEQGADIFQRGSMLVRPSWERIECADGRTDTAIRLVPLRLPSMRDQFTAAAVFQRYSKTSDAWYAVDCPPDVAATYLEREGLWKLRRLAGVTNCPTLRPDGTLLDRPGYDPATGLLYLPDGRGFPAVPETPSRNDALAALAPLKSLISTFPFAGEDGGKASRSVALSGMLTALVRRSLATAPLHAYTAPSWGSGKSMLVDLAALLATGSMAPVIAQGRSEEETEKRLGAALIAGDPIISLDNCDEPLSGVLLCQALTQQRVEVRILGQSKNVRVPGNAAMFATGNNLTVQGDATRRVLMCSIDPGVERPELRVFKTDPIKTMLGNRGAYVAAALTILRAFIVAGRPQATTPLGSFEGWSRLVRDGLAWLGEADPCDTMESIRAADPKREELAALVYHWHKVIGERPVTAKEVIAATTGLAGESEEGQARAGLLDALLAVAASFVKGPTAIDPVRLGKYLSKHAGRVLNGRAIVRDGQPAMGKQRWRLK